VWAQSFLEEKLIPAFQNANSRPPLERRDMATDQLSMNSVVQRAEGFVTAEIDNEVAMLNIDQGTCYGLNKVGSHVWNLIGDPKRVGEICDDLLRKFEVERSVCEQQVLELLENLRAEGLVQTRG
jgi:hypothetical protein